MIMIIILNIKKGLKMKNILIIIISLSFIKTVYSENITMKYGGDWVNTTMIQNGDFMSMAGSFVGTNVMQMGDEEIRTDVSVVFYIADK